MHSSASFKAFAVLALFACSLSCQQAVAEADVAEANISNFAVRMEVPAGTPGSMQYSETVEGARGLWFGEAQTFHLSYAGLSKSPNAETVVQFEILHQEKVAFSDLTEANIGQHMAIEVDGEVLCFPILNDRLPGAGVIHGSGDDWETETARDIVYSLRTGGQERE